MKKKSLLALLLSIAIIASLATGCGKEIETSVAETTKVTTETTTAKIDQGIAFGISSSDANTADIEVNLLSLNSLNFDKIFYKPDRFQKPVRFFVFNYFAPNICTA